MYLVCAWFVLYSSTIWWSWTRTTLIIYARQCADNIKSSTSKINLTKVSLLISSTICTHLSTLCHEENSPLTRCYVHIHISNYCINTLNKSKTIGHTNDIKLPIRGIDWEQSHLPIYKLMSKGWGISTTHYHIFLTIY